MSSEDYRRAQQNARQLANILTRLEALERGAGLRNSAIGAGGMRVRGGGSIYLEDGGDFIVTDGGHIDVSGGGGFTVIDGGNINVAGGGDIAVTGGGSVSIADGGNLDVTGGGDMLVHGGRLLFRRLGAETPGSLYAQVGDSGRTILRMYPPTESDGPRDTYFFLEGRSSQTQGMAYLGAGNQVQVDAGRNAYITAQELLRVRSHENLRLEGADSFALRTVSESHNIRTVGDDLLLTAPERVGVINSRLYVWGNIGTSGDISASGSKNFIIEHPLDDTKALVHASTESPVAGLEYWGEDAVGEDGTVTVELPDYFEALAARDHRGVQLTPYGPAVALGASRVKDGRFVVNGPAGTEFSWLVKARRGDEAGQFEVEPDRDVAGLDPEPLPEPH